MNSVWLTKARARLLGPLLWLLAINGLCFLAYTLPRTLQERRLAERATALEADVERERQGIARLKERAALIRANAADKDAFYRGLAEPDKLIATLEELDTVAPSSGARGYRPGVVKAAPVTRFVVTMPVSGSYSQLLAFLRAVERLPHFVTIDRIALREREPAADLDVELSVYFRGEPGGKRG